MEIQRKFEVSTPAGATPDEEERAIDDATDQEIDRLIDDLGGGLFK